MREDVSIEQFRTSPAATAAPAAEGLTALGRAVDPADPKCLAKRVPLPRAKSEQYFVCVSTNEERRLFDPLTDDLTHVGVPASTGLPRWKLERVPEDAFRYYAEYLRAGNPARLREAQRSI